MTAEDGPVKGRANQKLRTRQAIVAAARELVRTGAPITMPEVARAALVSEVTAYRYFPDLPSLISEAIVGLWPTATQALEPVASSSDPVERVAFACEVFLRGVAAYQGGVRAMIAATVVHPAMARFRPYIRGELIDLALEPLRYGAGAAGPDALARLKRELTAVVSAETLFCFTDRLGLETDDAIAHIARMAATLTAAATQQSPTRQLALSRR
jgi:AcrR family transcriptional regulator